MINAKALSRVKEKLASIFAPQFSPALALA